MCLFILPTSVLQNAEIPCSQSRSPKGITFREDISQRFPTAKIVSEMLEAWQAVKRLGQRPLSIIPTSDTCPESTRGSKAGTLQIKSMDISTSNLSPKIDTCEKLKSLKKPRRQSIVNRLGLSFAGQSTSPSWGGAPLIASPLHPSTTTHMSNLILIPSSKAVGDLSPLHPLPESTLPTKLLGDQNEQGFSYTLHPNDELAILPIIPKELEREESELGAVLTEPRETYRSCSPHFRHQSLARLTRISEEVLKFTDDSSILITPLLISPRILYGFSKALPRRSSLSTLPKLATHKLPSLDRYNRRNLWHSKSFRSISIDWSELGNIAEISAAGMDLRLQAVNVKRSRKMAQVSTVDTIP